jgi:hypothetical protein
VNEVFEPSPGGPEDSADVRGFAGFDEFSRALVEIGLVGYQELQSIPVGSAKDVLGLSQALIQAGILTRYQAASVYQRKSHGLLVGKYIILDGLGHGPSGAIFRARNRLLGHVVALRILPASLGSDDEAVARTRRTIEAVARLEHRNVAAVLEADCDRDSHYLVSEYVHGLDLDRMVRERGPMPIGQAIDCVIQAARGLEAAHAHGIVHGDIKPGKLMLQSSGTVRVLDLALASILRAADPRGEAAHGRSAEEWIDVHGLGCTLYYLLTGRLPFDTAVDPKRPPAHSMRIAPTLRAIRPNAPPKLESVVERMTAGPPNDRPGSMSEVIALLESCKTRSDETTGATDRATMLAESHIVDPSPRPRSSGAKPQLDASLWMRRHEPEGLRINRAVCLEDLMMEVLPHVAPLRKVRASKPPLARSDPLHHRRRKSSASRRRRFTVFLLAILAGAALGIAFVGLVWLPASNRTDASHMAGRSFRPADTSAATNAARDRAQERGQLPAVVKARWEVKRIFDGTSGQNWMLLNRKPLSRAHVERDGLNPHGTGSYMVVYQQKLADFVLDFDYKLTRGCNSGVFLRVSNLNDPINTGLEVALDDTSGTGLHDPGAIDDLVAPTVQAQLPAGTWNHMTVLADGPMIRVALNGTEVSMIDLDGWILPGKRPDGSPHKYRNVAVAGLARSGYIGFQDHGRDCWFKNVVVQRPSAARN